MSETTATSILDELGDIRRFSVYNQINTFIGIDLRHYESGNFLAKAHITKRGKSVCQKNLVQVHSQHRFS